MVTFENPLTFMGGVEVHAIELTRALRELGVDARLVTRSPDGQAPPEDPWGVPVHWIRVPLPRGPLPSYHHRRLMRPFFHAAVRGSAGKADLVHSQDDAGMGGLGHAPVVATVHTDVRSEFEAARKPLPAGLAQRLAVRWDIRRWRGYADDVDACIAVSPSTAQRLREDLAFDPVVIPNGIASTEKIPREQARQRTGAPFERCIVYLGRLARVKRPDRLVDALSELPEDVGLRIGGKGPEREALEVQARELGVEERVELLGFVPEEEKLAVLASGDVFALPSEHEGQPITLLEALGQGVPVVTSDLGWLPSELHPYAYQAPVPEGRAGLVTAVGEALERGRLDAVPVPSWADVAEETLGVYEQVLETTA